MRGIVLMSAAAVILAFASGCDTLNGERNPYPQQEQARVSAPRPNLHPLSPPPPGAGQPMQGNAPTRIPASPYNDPAYADPNYARAGYGPGMTAPSPEYSATPRYVAPMPTTPIPVSTPMPATTLMQAPASPMSVPSPSAMSLAAGYGYDGRGGLGPYDTSIYGTPTAIVSDAPRMQRSYGRTEGTADIAIPIGAMGMPVAPAPSGATPAPAYSGGAYPMAADIQSATGAVRLVPAPDIPPGIHPNDAGPSQWFEVVRPGNGPIRIGRVSATCVCVGVRVPKRQIAAGERALVEARILTRPKVNNLTYGIYVNLVEPQQAVVDADVTVSL